MRVMAGRAGSVPYGPVGLCLCHLGVLMAPLAQTRDGFVQKISSPGGMRIMTAGAAEKSDRVVYGASLEVAIP